MVATGAATEVAVGTWPAAGSVVVRLYDRADLMGWTIGGGWLEKTLSKARLAPVVGETGWDSSSPLLSEPGRRGATPTISTA